MVAPHSAKFLFIPDLTAKATGLVLVVLLVLYVVTMVSSSLLSTATADRNQRLMAIFLPLVFTFIIIGFPAGLIVYWIATNTWTIGQGYAIRRRMPPLPSAAGAAAAGRGGWSRRAARWRWSRRRESKSTRRRSERGEPDAGEGRSSGGLLSKVMAPPPARRRRTTAPRAPTAPATSPRPRPRAGQEEAIGTAAMRP